MPDPNLPRSAKFLSSSGSLHPIRMLDKSSSSFIPMPSSMINMYGLSDGGHLIFMFSASAVIELSIMSDIAELKL